MLRVLTAPQLAEWEAWYSIEPFGQYPEYWRSGMIAATIANVNRGKKEDKLFQPSDFMPTDFEAEDPKQKTQSVQEQKAALEGIFRWAKKKNMVKTEESKNPDVKVKSAHPIKRTRRG